MGAVDRPWRRLPIVIVRSAGYPFGWLDELGTGATAAAFASGRDADAPAVRAVYQGEIRASSTALITRFCTEPGLRDAVQFSNARLWRVIGPWLNRRAGSSDGWRSADRQRVDTLTLLLQRFCAKNDTTSHFGPITTGTWADDRTGVDFIAREPRRHTRLSRWAAERLLDLIADVDGAHVLWRPRRAPGCSVRHGELRVVDYDFAAGHRRFASAVAARSVRELSDAQARVLQLCDGQRSVDDIRAAYEAAAGRPLPVADAVAIVRGLADWGAVRPGPEIPYGLHNALPVLREFAAQLGNPALLRDLDRLGAALARLETATDEAGRSVAISNVDETFAAVTADQPYRAAGATYGDRTVFNEDCDSEHGHMLLGQPLDKLVERDLSSVYDTFMLLPRARFLAERRMLRTWFTATFPPNGSVPVHEFVTACLRDERTLTAHYDEIDREIQRLGAKLTALLFPEEQATSPYAISDDAVDAMRELLDVDVPVVCNPDLMIAADGVAALARGDYLAVVGDLHATEEGLSHGMFTPWAESALGEGEFARLLMAAYREILEPDEDLADVTHRHRNKHFTRLDLPWVDIEACDRSPKGPASRVRLHDLVITTGPRGLRLHLPSSERGLRLTAPPLFWQGLRRNPFAVFSFPQRTEGLPVPLGGRRHLPRLVRSNVVLQREMWALPASRFHGLRSADWFAGFAAVQQTRRDYGLPRHAYVTLPQEMKPIYCDLDSPLLVRQLSRLARAAGDGDLVLTEMLPAPHQLWLIGRRGAVTGELRYAVFSPSTEAGRHR
jgi:hypothetical protein